MEHENLTTQKTIHILIIAGETSGDMHGAELIKEMKASQTGLSFFGIGGDRMIAQGLQPIRHSSEMAFLGFIEVVKHLRFINRVFHEMLDALEAHRPALVILIDYPGFNLRFARLAKQRGFRTLYYISPQIWAWKKGRLKKMVRTIDRMLVILPFEVDLYREKGMDAHFVGHPLKGRSVPKQKRSAFIQKHHLNGDSPLVGLLPGSRKQEIAKLLPEMSQACLYIQAQLPDAQFILGMAPDLTETDYLPFIKTKAKIVLVDHDTYGVMAHAHAVLVASGTATLETALFGTPMVICYKMASLSYVLGRLLIKIKCIGLVNIVVDKKIVPELIQNHANAREMASTILPMLKDPEYIQRLKTDLNHVSNLLGEFGASKRAAKLALEMLRQG